MIVAMFYHSLVSDWNHGNAHFLRGIASELIARGHEVRIFEPRDSWSRLNLIREHGEKPVKMFHEAYPELESTAYDLASFDLDAALDGAELVIVHEWSDPELVRRAGERRARAGGHTLLFHDTHHRMVTDRASMDAYDLSNYDGVLAYGEVLAKLYRQTGQARRAWTWHEAADTRVFRPQDQPENQPSFDGDLVWIGNWGDEERSRELHEFLIGPVRDLKLKARVHGVRYPDEARRALAEAGIEHAGWLPNFEAPAVFARHRVTLHVPRRPYVEALPGIPTIRPFEALACGIPLLSSPWNDCENLFRPGQDFLFARDGREMRRQLEMVLGDARRARDLAASGRETICLRHTCSHRVDQLLAIHAEAQRTI